MKKTVLSIVAKWLALIAAVAVGGMPSSLDAAGFDPTNLGDFASVVNFEVTGYDAGKPTLANFPVLVRLSENKPAGFHYADCAADGSDLRFGDADWNLLVHEIDEWNTDGESLVWVKVPALTNNAVFWMAYNGTPNAANPATNTWSGYTGVWHMNEASGDVADATGHGLTATPSGPAAASQTSTTGAPVGKGRVNATSTAAGSKAYLSVPNYNSFGLGNTFTLSMWVRQTAATGVQRPASRKDVYSESGGWDIVTQSGSTKEMVIRGSGNSYRAYWFNPTFDTWQLQTYVYNGATLTVYQNGAPLTLQSSSGTFAAPTDNGKPLAFGCTADGSHANFWVGSFDEFRLADGVASADWIQAEYDTVTSSSFLTNGVVIARAPGITVSSSASEIGEPTPDYGVYTNKSEVGTKYDFSCPEEVVVKADEERWHCVGYKLFKIEDDWSNVLEHEGNSNTVSIVYAHQVRLEWQWQHEYYLTVTAGAGGSITGGASGWYADGASVSLTAVPSDGYSFFKWDGSVALSAIYDTTVSVTNDAAKSVSATFLASGTPICTWSSSDTGNSTNDFFAAGNWDNVPTNDGDIVRVNLPANAVTKTLTISSALNFRYLDIGTGDGLGTLVLDFQNGLTTNQVAGDVRVRSGVTLTHKMQNAKANTEAYKLNLEVGGDMTLDSGASINLMAKGFQYRYGPGRPSSDYAAAAHGGQGGRYSSSYYVNSSTYGSIRQPDRPGSGGGGWVSDHIGGGAVHLKVTGNMVLNGTIDARGKFAGRDGATVEPRR